MKIVSKFSEFINESKLQDDYREFFSKLLKLYGVKSPLQFKNNKEQSMKFYKDIEDGWSKGNGLTKYGKELMEKEEEEKED